MKCNASSEKRWKEKMNQGEWYRPIGILGGRDKWNILVLRDYVVAFLSRDVISVSRGGGNRWWMQLDGLSDFRKKSRQSLSRLSKIDGSSAYCNATQYHGIDIVTG